MRTACLAVLILLATGCESPDSLPTSSALPKPIVTLESAVVKRDLVRLIWRVRDGDGRKLEIMRRNDDDPWKHLATVIPADGRVQIDDTAVVPGQPYTYRLRIFAVTNGSFLDEVEVEIPQ